MTPTLGYVALVALAGLLCAALIAASRPSLRRAARDALIVSPRGVRTQLARPPSRPHAYAAALLGDASDTVVVLGEPGAALDDLKAELPIPRTSDAGVDVARALNAHPVDALVAFGSPELEQAFLVALGNGLRTWRVRMPRGGPSVRRVHART